MKISSYIEKQLIDNNLDSIMLTDEKCIIEYANKRAIELYGYPLHELVGKSVNIFEVNGKEIPESARDTLRQTGKWSGEAWRLCKDGTVFYGALSIFALYDEAGKIAGYVANTRDITQTVAITDALLEKQQRLQSIVNNTTDIIVSIDRDFNIVEFNQVLAALVKMGYGHALEPGDPMLNYIDPAKHTKLRQLYARVLQGERLTDVEIFETREGGLLYYETSYNPIYAEDKSITGISIFSKNITDRIRGEQALKKAFEEKELLLSEIHHRIKNNLAIISSVLQLQEININNEEAIKCLRESRMRIKSAALLHEMMYQNNALDRLYVKEYLYNMFNDINNSIGNKEHKLTIAGDDASLLIHNAIPAGLLFNEIFTNSIKHGFKHVPHGEIAITIQNRDNLTHFEITENVAAFPEHIDIEATHSTELLLIKNFTEQLNGTIQLLKKPNTTYLLSLDLTC